MYNRGARVACNNVAGPHHFRVSAGCLTPILSIEVLVPSHESQCSCIPVLGVSMLSI